MLHRFSGPPAITYDHEQAARQLWLECTAMFPALSPAEITRVSINGDLTMSHLNMMIPLHSIHA